MNAIWSNTYRGGLEVVYEALAPYFSDHGRLGRAAELVTRCAVSFSISDMRLDHTAANKQLARALRSLSFLQASPKGFFV